MKISVERSLLVDAVSNVSRIVNPRSVQPALEGVLLQTVDGMLNIMGSDGEITIITNITANIDIPGGIILSAKLFSDMVRKMSSTDIIITTHEDNHVKVIGNMEFTLIGIKPENFPALPEITGTSVFTVELNADTLRDMIDKTHFAISTSDLKPAHTGSLFDIKNGVFNLVSLDGYRLALRTERLDAQSELSFIVPGKTLSEISKLIPTTTDDADNVLQINMTLTDKHVFFKVGEYNIISRLLEGEFIDYEKSIPHGYKTRVTVNVREMISALERASLLINEKIKQPLKLSFDNNKIKISCQTTIGRSYEEVACRIEGTSVETGFNNRYLLDAMKNVDCDEIVFEINTALSPMKVLPPTENPHFTFLVLPVRLKTE